jgi:hypothetical protein
MKLVRTTWPQRSLALLLGLAFTSAGGCGSAETGYPLVTGRVYYHGQPLAGGLIVFTPDEERGNSGPLAKAIIGPDGRFSLRAEGKLGASPGWHRITIAPAPVASKSTRLQLYQSPPIRLRSPQFSGLTREVKAGSRNAFDFLLDDS